MGRLHDAAKNGRTDLVREYHGDGVNDKTGYCGELKDFVYFFRYFCHLLTLTNDTVRLPVRSFILQNVI